MTANRLWLSLTVTTALLALALPLWGLTSGRFGTGLFPVRWVEVEGSFQRVTAEQLRSAVLPELRRGFFGTSLEQVQQRVMALSWVEACAVRKSWPDAVVIAVRERQPVARFGHDRLIDAHGVLFAVEGELPGALPRLDGPVERVDELLAFFKRARAELATHGLDVEALELSERGAWSVTVGHGVRVLLGREAVDARWARLLRSWPKLPRDEGRKLISLDLRYTNGVAAHWLATEPEPAPDALPPTGLSLPSTPAVAVTEAAE